MRKVILDVDTGSDDAVAILCAVLSGELDVVGICTECLLPIQVTTENTLKVLHLLGSKIPVYRGSHQAMVQNLNPLRKRKKVFNQPMIVDGKEVRMHMPFDLPLGEERPQEKDAASFYVDYLRSSQEKVTIVLTGPMTNLALALLMEPSIVDNIEELVIMGGGYQMSNVTLCAESNVFRDPEAAQRVLHCGVRITLLPLDATHSASLNLAHQRRIQALGNPFSDFTVSLMESRRAVYDKSQPLSDETGSLVPLHDVICVAYLLHPEVLTEIRDCHCQVSCSDGPADGQTIIDNRFYTAPSNIRLALKADREILADFLVETRGKGGKA